MTDSTGAVVWRAYYKPFGNEYLVQGSINTDNRFVGSRKDTETGLNYFGARYMDTPLGRFTSPDPIGPVDPKTGKFNQKILSDPKRLNYYSYALNDPVNKVDPWGLFTLNFDKGVNTTDKKFISTAFSQLHDKVTNNQTAIDFYKRLDIDIVAASKMDEGPCISINVNKNIDYHGAYGGGKMDFYGKAFISPERALYTIAHEFGHWAAELSPNTWLGLQNYPLFTPDPKDPIEGYAAERVTMGNIMRPNGTIQPY